jgi:regulator of PEP synthase PpsR (kinase-PPPase family)
MNSDQSENEANPPNIIPEKRSVHIYVLSGGVGASGEQLVRTVMAQFPDADIQVKIFPKLSNQNQIEQIIQDATTVGAITAHTFVDPELRKIVKQVSQDKNLVAIDLVGPFMEGLAEKLDQIPLGKPGLYRKLYKSYFDRIGAMDYGLDHDDGKNPGGWPDAEIVLLGASRVGKTPISLYLSVMGWRVANIPLVAGILPRESLLTLDRRRVVGLTIAPGELIQHRKYRQSALGVGGRFSDYVDPQKVYEEIEEIENFYQRNNISSVDVSGKPIETSADEIIRLIRRKMS